MFTLFCQPRAMRRILPMLILSCVLAAPALASEAEKKPAEKNSPDAGSTVEMPYLIAPIIVDEKLIAYAYVSSKIVATSQTAAIDVRMKTAFIQDAFVRDVNGTPIGKEDDPATVDEEALRSRLLADVKRIMGQGKVKDFRFIQIQVTQLRPAPTPRAATN